MMRAIVGLERELFEFSFSPQEIITRNVHSNAAIGMERAGRLILGFISLTKISLHYRLCKLKKAVSNFISL